MVNNEAITQREVDRFLAPIYEQYRALYYGDELVARIEEAKQKVMEQLIEDKLILSEARLRNIEVDETDLDGRIGEAIKRAGSKERFEAALKEQGLSLRDLRARYKDQAMVRKLIDQKIGAKITVTPVEVNNYYNNHSGEFIQPEQVKLRNILIRPRSEAGVKEALDLAKDILIRLQKGEDFAALAKEYSSGPNASEGGLMGYVKRGDLLPEIDKIIAGLEEGSISDIVQTPLGYHIFKVEERSERKAYALSDVRHDIEEAIFREKAKEKIKSWVGDLKKNAYISFK